MREEVAKWDNIFIVILLSFGLFGCATVNFSSKYYTLPEDYKKDIEQILTSARIPITHSYAWVICIDQCDRNASGVLFFNPDDRTIYLPKTFLQYIYEFYYNHRAQILVCTFLHEITHNEFGIASKPPETHYLCDKAVIEKFFNNNGANPISNVFYTPNEMYSTLIVTQDYWRARKGLGGHLANVGWNLLNLATLAYAGSGTFVDWFATDISVRINLLRRDYPNCKFIFKRSDKNDAITSSENIQKDN